MLPLSIFKSPSKNSRTSDDLCLNETEPRQPKPDFYHANDTAKLKSRKDFASNIMSRQDEVLAVRVNPQAFILSERRLRFEAVIISKDDPVFVEQRTSSLSSVLGIKLVGRTMNANIEGSTTRRLSDINFDAQHLYRSCDVEVADLKTENRRDWDHQFGKYELANNIIGPMILARYDRKPLHVLHTMAILKFAETVMTPLFDQYQQTRKSWRSIDTHFEHQREVMQARLEIAGKAHPKKFNKFWANFKDEKVKGHSELLLDEDETTVRRQVEMWMVDREELTPRPEWADVPSPYDVGQRFGFDGLDAVQTVSMPQKLILVHNVVCSARDSLPDSDAN